MRSIATSLFVFLLPVVSPLAETVSIGAAHEFADAAKKLAPLFTAETGHTVTYKFEVSDVMWSHLIFRMPYDIYLSGTDIASLSKNYGSVSGLGDPVTYAFLPMALYSTSLDLSDGRAVLENGAFSNMVIPGPRSDYRQRAMALVETLGVADAVSAKLIVSESDIPVLDLAEAGVAELALFPSTWLPDGQNIWIVPADLQKPTAMEAVLTEFGTANPAAVAYMAFLSSDAAKEVIRDSGFLID